MNKAKYILRGTLLLLIILLLINLIRKTDDNLARIVKFKLETLGKIKNDSLDTKHIKSLVNETTEFSKQIIDESPRVKEGIHYLIGAVVLLILAELGFFISERRKIGS